MWSRCEGHGWSISRGAYLCDILRCTHDAYPQVLALFIPLAVVWLIAPPTAVRLLAPDEYFAVFVFHSARVFYFVSHGSFLWAPTTSWDHPMRRGNDAPISLATTDAVHPVPISLCAYDADHQMAGLLPAPAIVWLKTIPA
jgi:hypothetical protein